MNKRQVVNCGISGLALEGSDVVRVKRGSKGSVLVQRHRWSESDDGRALSAVSRAGKGLAQEIADRTGRSVEIYTRDGHMLYQIHPVAE